MSYSEQPGGYAQVPQPQQPPYDSQQGYGQYSGPPGGYPQGGPVPGAPQPYYPVAPQPQKKSRVGLIIGIIAGVLVLGCGGVVTAGLLAAKSSGGSTSTGSGKKYGLNEAARDGKFEFVVSKVTCGKAREGDDDLNKAAQGQYCEVALSIKNIGNKPQTFDGSDQKAKSSTGATYTDDGEAEIYANPNDETFLNDINPGNTANGILVFDIPKGAQIASVELHDSTFSGGVTVNVA